MRSEYDGDDEQERLLIGETWMPAIAGIVRDVLDPASREVIAQVADADQADVEPRPGGVRRRGLARPDRRAASEDPMADR
jgi:NADPH-dependent ferric siderophore reductase